MARWVQAYRCPLRRLMETLPWRTPHLLEVTLYSNWSSVSSSSSQTEIDAVRAEGAQACVFTRSFRVLYLSRSRWVTWKRLHPSAAEKPKEHRLWEAAVFTAGPPLPWVPFKRPPLNWGLGVTSSEYQSKCLLVSFSRLVSCFLFQENKPCFCAATSWGNSNVLSTVAVTFRSRLANLVGETRYLKTSYPRHRQQSPSVSMATPFRPPMTSKSKLENGKCTDVCLTL